MAYDETTERLGGCNSASLGEVDECEDVGKIREWNAKEGVRREEAVEVCDTEGEGALVGKALEWVVDDLRFEINQTLSRCDDKRRTYDERCACENKLPGVVGRVVRVGPGFHQV